MNALRLEVAGGRATLVAVEAAGSERELARWPLDVDGDDAHPVELLRSPSGAHASVRVGDRAWTVAVADGTIVHAEHEPRRRTACDPHGFDDQAIHHWDAAEHGRLHRVHRGAPLRALVAPGTTLLVEGPIVDDHGESASGSSLLSMYGLPGTPQAELDREMRRARRVRRERDEAPVHVRVAVRTPRGETVVHEETTTALTGFERIAWPVFATPRGLLLRRIREQARTQTSGVATQDQVVQHPWLVSPDGVLRTLPFAWGNQPIATWPDGRLLLPCIAPMWIDGMDEPLSVAGYEHDETDILTLGDAWLTPIHVARAVDPEITPPPGPDPYDQPHPWEFLAATATADRLTLAVAPADRTAHRPWLLLELPVDGTACGPPRVLARGTVPPDGGIAFAL